MGGAHSQISADGDAGADVRGKTRGGNKDLGPRSGMVGVGVHAGGGELGGQRWFSEAVVRESHR